LQVLPVKLEVADNTGKASRRQGTIALQNPTGSSVDWSYSIQDVNPRLRLIPASGRCERRATIFPDAQCTLGTLPLRNALAAHAWPGTYLRANAAEQWDPVTSAASASRWTACPLPCGCAAGRRARWSAAGTASASRAGPWRRPAPSRPLRARQPSLSCGRSTG